MNKVFSLVVIFFLLLISASFSSMALTNQDPDLIGLWFLDDAGSQIVDSKDNGRQLIDMGYNGILNEQTALVSYSVFSLGFDNVDDHAHSNISTLDSDGGFDGNTVLFNKSTGFTASCWSDKTAVGDDGVMGTNGLSARGWMLRHSSDPNVFCRFWHVSGNVLAIAAGSFFNGMYTCIFNDTGVFLYVNDTLSASTASSATIHQNDANLTLGAGGRDGSFTQVPFNGDVDECSIWNRSLTNAEITDLFDNGVEVVLPPTVIVNSSWNVTANVFSNGNSSLWNTGGQVNFSFVDLDASSLSFVVTTDIVSNMTCSLTEANYSEMLAADPLSKAATTDTVNHSYTLSDNFTTEGQNCMYCSFATTDLAGDSLSGVSASGCLDNFINTEPVNNTIVNPISFSTVSGVTLIDWNPFSDVNLHTYEVFLTNDLFLVDISFNFTHFYRFEEGSGSVALNSFPDVNGTITGATYVSSLGSMGTEDFALFFDGLNDGVLMDDNSVGNFQKNDSWSTTFWAKWTSAGAADMIINKQTSAGDLHGWLIFPISTGEVDFLITGTPSGSRMRIRTSASYNDGTWRHFVFTYNGSQNVSGMKIYVDSINVGVTVLNDNIGSSTITNSEVLSFGSRHNADLFWLGTLDEVGIIDSVLLQDDITNLFNNGLTNTTMTINTTFIGNTTGAVSELNFNFSTVTVGINYTVNVRGYDDYDTVGLGFNSFIFNELFTPPLPAGFFNVTLLNPSNITFSSLPINFSWSIGTNNSMSVNSSCSLFINDTIFENFSVFNTSGVQSNVVSSGLVNGSFIWNITCDFGVALNGPFSFTFQEPFINESTPLFGALDGSCPDTTSEALMIAIMLAICFALLWVGLKIPMFGVLGSLLLFVTSFLFVGCSNLFSFMLFWISILLLMYYAGLGVLRGYSDI